MNGEGRMKIFDYKKTKQEIYEKMYINAEGKKSSAIYEIALKTALGIIDDNIKEKKFITGDVFDHKGNKIGTWKKSNLIKEKFNV